MDRVNLRRDSILISAEINESITLLVPAATMPRSDLPLIVPPPRFALALKQLLGRLTPGGDVRKIADTRSPPSWRCRFVSPDAHVFIPGR